MVMVPAHAYPGYKMKRFSMGVAALMTIAPALFFKGSVFADPSIAMLIVVVLGWACVEFYIGFSRTSKGRAPSPALVKICRMVWPIFIIYAWLDYHNSWTRLNLPWWFSALLILICILALVMRVWAVIQLGDAFSYDVICPQGGILITTGPYRIIRHPAYLAICILGSFPGLILGSILGFIGMWTSTILTVVFRMVAEEQMLKDELGALFLKYQRNTYRLIPFIY
jgi:protein-S-isoprenylcysteine O-methyltransferase Ste14